MSLADSIAFGQELFAGLGPVSSRRMFGGAGLYAEGVMFALIADDEIYMKGDDALGARYEAAGSAPFIYEGKKGKPARMRYWRLPDSAHDDSDEALDWARASLECALAAKK